MALVLGSWLSLADSLATKEGKELGAAAATSSTSGRHERLEDVVVEIVAKQALHSFDRSKMGGLRLENEDGDMKELLHDPAYRKMLLQLYERHGHSSALLSRALASISAEGHHAEIANAGKSIFYLRKGYIS